MRKWEERARCVLFLSYLLFVVPCFSSLMSMMTRNGVRNTLPRLCQIKCEQQQQQKLRIMPSMLEQSQQTEIYDRKKSRIAGDKWQFMWMYACVRAFMHNRSVSFCICLCASNKRKNKRKQWTMRCSSSCFASTVRFSFIYLLCVCCLVLLTRVSPLTLTIAASRTALLFPPGERNKKSMILYGNFDVFLVNFFVHFVPPPSTPPFSSY